MDKVSSFQFIARLVFNSVIFVRTHETSQDWFLFLFSQALIVEQQPHLILIYQLLM